MAKASSVAHANSTGFVTVACNMPRGVQLRIDKMVDEEEMTQNGTKTVQRAVQVGDRVKLHGTATAFGVAPKHPVVMGYALTKNVPADFWNAWLAANKNSDLFRNGCVFAYEKSDDLKGALKDRRDTKSGLHALDMSDSKHPDPRAPRGIKPGSKDDDKDGADEEAEEAAFA